MFNHIFYFIRNYLSETLDNFDCIPSVFIDVVINLFEFNILAFLFYNMFFIESLFNIIRIKNKSNMF